VFVLATDGIEENTTFVSHPSTNCPSALKYHLNALGLLSVISSLQTVGEKMTEAVKEESHQDVCVHINIAEGGTLVSIMASITNGA